MRAPQAAAGQLALARAIGRDAFGTFVHAAAPHGTQLGRRINTTSPIQSAPVPRWVWGLGFTGGASSPPEEQVAGGVSQFPRSGLGGGNSPARSRSGLGFRRSRAGSYLSQAVGGLEHRLMAALLLLECQRRRRRGRRRPPPVALLLLRRILRRGAVDWRGAGQQQACYTPDSPSPGGPSSDTLCRSHGRPPSAAQSIASGAVLARKAAAGWDRTHLCRLPRVPLRAHLR